MSALHSLNNTKSENGRIPSRSGRSQLLSKVGGAILAVSAVTAPFIAMTATQSPVSAASTAPTFSWIAAGDGTGSSNAPVNAVATDSLGNSYITGWLAGTLDFAGDGIGGANSFGDVVTTTQDAYLAQYSSSGVLQWVKHISGSGTEFTTGVTVDANDNVIVTGSFGGTVDFAGDGVGGSGDLVSLGSNDLFTAKYSAAGNFVWAVKAGGVGNDSGWQGAVSTDSSRNVYLHVPFTGTADFGQDGIGGAGDLVSLGGTTDAAVVKYNSAGVFQWANRIGGTGTEWPQEVATDSSNNILVIGNSSSSVTDLGGDGIGGTSDVTNRGNYDAYIAKYTSAGVLTWAKSIGSTGSDWGADVSVGSGGSVLVTANFKLTMDSAGNGIGGANASDDLISAGGDDVMVAKYSSSGDLVWSKRYGSTGDENSVDGDVDASGNYYITGAFNGTVDFAGDGVGGDGDLVSAGGADVFTAKYTTSGSFEWALRGGGTSGDGGFLGGIDVSPDGSTIHIGDLFAGSIDFAGNGIGGANSSGDRVASGNANFPFLVKYSSPIVQSAQTVTWSPTTTLSVSDSPRTPSSLASTNGNGTLSYSVVSAGSTGCSVVSTTGVLTFSAAGSCTIRATAAATSTYLVGTKDVTFVVTTSASTTVVPTTTAPTTTVVTATTVAIGAAPVVTVAQGQASVATIAPRVGPTTTVLAPMRSQVPRSTTTTIPPVVTTVSNALAKIAPNAPKLAPGEAGAVVNGQKTSASLSRADNQITAIAGDITTTVSGLNSDGKRVTLNSDGNLVVNEGDSLVISATGFAPDSEVEVWVYSTPSQLGVITANADGKVSGTFALPEGLEVGDHRVVLSGENPNGEKATIGLGLSYGTVESGSSITRVLIAIPIALAILFGLFLPAVTRRRRKRLVTT